MALREIRFSNMTDVGHQLNEENGTTDDDVCGDSVEK